MEHNVFIVEDEPHALERLTKLLESNENLKVIGTADNVNEAIRLINEKRPDILLLDIQISGGTGFDVLKQLEMIPSTIFITAYDEFAVQAFEENAVDYILKPYSAERLQKAIDKAINKKGALTEEILNSLQVILQKKNYLKRIPIKFREEVLIIPEENIFYFRAEDKYVFLHTYDKHYIVEATLKELEQRLDPDRFLRIHKSYIVSLDKISKLKKWFFGEFIVVMKDKSQTELKAGRSYVGQLRDKLGL